MPKLIEITDFTTYKNTAAIIKKCTQLGKEREYSDIIDSNGHQYVDLVLEGGGTLGIALLGYIYALEKANIRFLSIAGTSAGSIAALLLAVGPIEQEKSEWMIKEMANKRFLDFVDMSNGDGKMNSQSFVDLVTGKGHWLERFIFTRLIDNFYGLLTAQSLGFVKGKDFSDWLKRILKGHGIKTLKDLRTKRSVVPAGFCKRNEVENAGRAFFDATFAEESLAFIAAEITTESKFIFPRDADLVWENVDEVSPIDFVRASMSIPIFFEPFEAKLADAQKKPNEKWATRHNYFGKTNLQKLVFIDGGVISNFPINIFHCSNTTPTAPTFGIKLGEKRNKVTKIENFKNILAASFNTARHALDNDFILNKYAY